MEWGEKEGDREGERQEGEKAFPTRDNRPKEAICKHYLLLPFPGDQNSPHLTQNLDSKVCFYGENHVESTINNFAWWYLFSKFSSASGLFFPFRPRSRSLSLSWGLDEVWEVCCVKNICLAPSQRCDMSALREARSNWTWQKWNLISGHAVATNLAVEWPAQFFAFRPVQSGSCPAKNWFIGPSLAWLNYFPNRSIHRFLTQRVCFFKSALTKPQSSKTVTSGKGAPSYAIKESPRWKAGNKWDW